jgi:two-component system, NarL family, sensor histidine kinase UhpB
MNMSRYILLRILGISVAILIAGLALALWRAQFDVKREERGAADEIRLFEYLYALEKGPSADIDANIEALRRINSSHNLRHVRFALSDDSGKMLVAPNKIDAPSFIERGFAKLAPGIRSSQIEPSGPWLLVRDDGRRFLAALALNPASEQQEAFDNLEGMLIVLLGYTAAILLAIYWTLKRALAPMRPILDAIDHYERNDFSARLSPLPFAETDAIGRALNHMAGTLDTAQEQRRALSLKLVSSQEDERSRIARELHDEFGQGLTAMRADVSWLMRRTAGRDELQNVLQGMDVQCERLHSEIRELLTELRPTDARASGFAASLEKLMADLVHSWSARLGESTKFTLHYAVAAENVPDEVALAVYRLTQEALTNCVRHAHAKNVAVTFEKRERLLQWSVEDDGVGVSNIDNSIEIGNGIAGMRERVWALGSDLEIGAATSSSPPGVRVAATFAARAS